MQTIRLFSMVFLFAVVTNVHSASGASTQFCEVYANEAIRQLSTAQKFNLPGITPPVWSNDWNGHYSWCLTVDEPTASNGTKLRQDYLDQHLAKSIPTPQVLPKVVPTALPLEGNFEIVQSKTQFCNHYADAALRQLQTAKKLQLDDIKPPVWSPDRKGHFDWCMRVDITVANQGTALRQQQLDKFVPQENVKAGGIALQKQMVLTYQGNSAHGDDHHGDFDELQGITNGDPDIDPYWFFSRNDSDTILYRVGYQHHLKNDFPCYVHHVRFINGVSCEHIGDIKYLRRPQTNEGYIFAAYDNCNNDRSYIAVFRSSDFKDISGNQLTTHALLDITNMQGKEAYVASAQPVMGRDDRVNIYSGAGKLPGTENKIYEYEVNWKDLKAGGIISTQSWKPNNLVQLDGRSFIAEDWQGIDFSGDGQFLFMTAGADSYSGCTSDDKYKKRIHIFKKRDDRTWEFYRSSEYRKNGDPFLYETNCEEEPEGLSWFDMNNVPNYHPDMPRGQLHVILLDNDASSDDVYIKHYARDPGSKVMGAVKQK